MRRYVFLALAIVLNSIGHSMTIVTNLGSMPWPASIVNIMHMMGWNMTETIFTEGYLSLALIFFWLANLFLKNLAGS